MAIIAVETSEWTKNFGTSEWLELCVVALLCTPLTQVPSQVDVPKLGKFYLMEVRILSEYYKKQESLSLIKVNGLMG